MATLEESGDNGLRASDRDAGYDTSRTVGPDEKDTSSPESPTTESNQVNTTPLVKGGDGGSATNQDHASPAGQDHDVRTVTGVKWFLAYASILATVFLFALDGTIVADLQPSILESLGNVGKLPWIGVSTSLGTLSILPHGKAFGVFNTKWYFLGCIIGFEAASALCGGAPTMDSFIIGRTMLGVCGSGVYAGGLVFIAVITTAKERPLYFSGVVAMWGLGSVLGPVVGGAFASSAATWRWGFYINLVIGAAFAPVFLFCLPSFNPQDLPLAKKLQTQDWAGIFVFEAGAACYTMAISFGGTTFAFHSGAEIALWVLTGAFLIAFGLITYFHPGVSFANRLFPAHLMKILEIVNLQFQVFHCLGGIMLTIYYTPLIFQFTRGDGPLDAGIRLLPLVCMMVLFSVLNGWGLSKYGYYMPWYVFGNAMILAGSILMFRIHSTTSPSHIYGYTALIGIGVGCFLTAGLSIAQTMVSASDMTNIVGFMTVAQNLGAVTFLGISGSVYQNIGVESLGRLLPNAIHDDVLELTTGVGSPLFKSLGGNLQSAIIEQVTLAIRNVFGVVVAGSGIGLILSLLLSRNKLSH